ncbi:unnamed protein product, partial [Staurois parvus]
MQGPHDPLLPGGPMRSQSAPDLLSTKMCWFQCLKVQGFPVWSLHVLPVPVW